MFSLISFPLSVLYYVNGRRGTGLRIGLALGLSWALAGVVGWWGGGWTLLCS